MASIRSKRFERGRRFVPELRHLIARSVYTCARVLVVFCSMDATSQGQVVYASKRGQNVFVRCESSMTSVMQTVNATRTVVVPSVNGAWFTLRFQHCLRQPSLEACFTQRASRGASLNTLSATSTSRHNALTLNASCNRSSSCAIGVFVTTHFLSTLSCHPSLPNSFVC